MSQHQPCIQEKCNVVINLLQNFETLPWICYHTTMSISDVLYKADAPLVQLQSAQNRVVDLLLCTHNTDVESYVKFTFNQT